MIPGQQHRNKDGAAVDVELTVRLIDYDGRPALLTVAEDVSERLRAERERRVTAEEQLRQSQKMDAARSAHRRHRARFQQHPDGDHRQRRGAGGEGRRSIRRRRKSLQRIAGSAERAEELTRQTARLLAQAAAAPAAGDLNDLVAETGKLLRRTLGGQIEIESHPGRRAVDASTSIAPSSRRRWSISASMRATPCPTGGRVLIETRNVSVDAALAAQEPRPRAGRYVLITVSDTGTRHPARGSRQGVRAVLHHQGERQGLGPRPQHGLWLRQAVARPYRGRQRSRIAARRSGSTCRASAARCPTRRPGAARR